MMNLIRRLPAQSELSREVHGLSAEEASWSRTDHLLAIVADRLAEANWMFASANSDDDIPQPEPIPRPGVSPPEIPASSDAADQAAFFAS